MSDEQAYEKLQELLAIAEDLKAEGKYSKRDIVDEIDLRLGD